MAMENKEKKLNIMFASHTYIGGPFMVGSHHLARELSNRGHRILHLSTSITPAHLLHMKRKTIADRFKHWWKIKGQGEPVINCVPFTWIPWKLAGRVFQRTGSNWFVKLIAFPTLAKLLKVHQFYEVDLLLIDQPYFAGIERYMNAKVILYRPTDNYKDMFGDKTVEAAEKEIVSKAHGIVATSSPVYQNIRKYKPELPAMIIENGVEYAHFSQFNEEPEELLAIPKPRAIYIGAIDDRLDLGAIKHLAEARQDLSLIIIGPHTPTSHLSFPSNVHFLGAIAYSRLPSFLHHVNLALLPMSDHAANSGRSPMKLYEYAAAGLPTVVTATPELQRRGEEFLYFYKGIPAFIEQVNLVLDKLSRNVISNTKISEGARQHSWEAKAEQIILFSNGLRMEEGVVEI
jgi:glycosyltransferase involved in cell wall biosynthesis